MRIGGGRPRQAPAHFEWATRGGGSPERRRIELAISNDSDLAFETQFVKFEFDGLLRADAAARAEVYAKALDPATGWMRREEARRLEDLEPER